MGPFPGHFVSCNNPANAITGWYIDASGVHHGFLPASAYRRYFAFSMSGGLSAA